MLSNRMILLSIFFLLFSGCANIDMHMPDQQKSGIKSSGVIILPIQENIGLQTFGGTTTGMGAIPDLVAELSLNSRIKDADKPLSELHILLDGKKTKQEASISISESIKRELWFSDLNIDVVQNIEGFNLKSRSLKSNGNVIILISPRYQLSPWLDMIETRTKVEFYYRSDLDKPFYSTLAITQSRIVEMPWLNKGASFQSYNKPVQPSIDYWKQENGKSLKQLINQELSEASRLIAICIEEAVYPDEKNRRNSSIKHEDLTGQGWGFSLDGYYLSEYSNEERDIIRRIPQPMQYPAHAINAIFSIPKGQSLQTINNRH